MAAPIHTRFTPYSLEGKQFIQLWNRQNKDGGVKKMAKVFNISVSTVQTIRTKLGLRTLHDPKHPGRAALIRTIKNNYKKGRGTEYIGRLPGVRLSPWGVRHILLSEGVKLRPPHVTNPVLYPTKQTKYTPTQLMKKIKELWVYKGFTVNKISNELGISREATSNKLRAMGFDTTKHNVRGTAKLPKAPVGAKCQWCGKQFETLWITKGKRAQKFCRGSSCSEMAKEFRRLCRKHRVSPPRLEDMKNYLKAKWGDDYTVAVDKLLKVSPCVPTQIDDKK